VRHAKDAPGTKVTVMADATEGWNYTQAVETAHVLQEAGAGWLEDPIKYQDYSGLSKIRDIFKMPVTVVSTIILRRKCALILKRGPSIL
jgi:L-alanine-DL-glutamate epimerase-like enolase superfamily enzyme